MQHCPFTYSLCTLLHWVRAYEFFVQKICVFVSQADINSWICIYWMKLITQKLVHFVIIIKAQKITSYLFCQQMINKQVLNNINEIKLQQFCLGNSVKVSHTCRAEYIRHITTSNLMVKCVSFLIMDELVVFAC